MWCYLAAGIEVPRSLDALFPVFDPVRETILHRCFASCSLNLPVLGLIRELT
jgi:hypothetical protein